MTNLLDRDWVVIDGQLEPIGFEGPADDRFPAELAEMVIANFSEQGDWILDPFCGLGTSLAAAEQLGRFAVGFERDPARASWAAGQVTPPSRVIAASCATIAEHQLPRFALIFTSPPYITVRMEDEPWGPTYFTDMQLLFAQAAQQVLPEGHIVVEVSDIKTDQGFRPFAGQMAQALGEVMVLERVIARINSSAWPAGPGVGHSSLLVFRPQG